MKINAFRDLVLERCEAEGVVFKTVVVVDDPSKYAAGFLARRGAIKGHVNDMAATTEPEDVLVQQLSNPCKLLEQRQGSIIRV